MKKLLLGSAGFILWALSGGAFISLFSWALGTPAIIQGLPSQTVGGYRLPFYLGISTNVLILYPVIKIYKRIRERVDFSHSQKREEEFE